MPRVERILLWLQRSMIVLNSGLAVMHASRGKWLSAGLSLSVAVFCCVMAKMAVHQRERTVLNRHHLMVFSMVMERRGEAHARYAAGLTQQQAQYAAQIKTILQSKP